MHLYLIRHGMASHNLPQGMGGHAVCTDPEVGLWVQRLGDSFLTPQGQIQVCLAGRRLSGVRFDAILSSPLYRTLATAEAIAKYQERPPVIECLPDLIEIGCHGRAWMPDELLNRAFGNLRLCGELQPTGAPAELPEDFEPGAFRVRAERVRTYLLDRFQGDENVLLVSHGGFMSRCLLPALFGLPADTDVQLCAENAALTKLVIGKGKRVIAALLNDDRHLGKYRSRDPLRLDWENIEGATLPLPEEELDMGLIGQDR